MVDCHVAFHHWGYPDRRYDYIGFRVASVAEPIERILYFIFKVNLLECVMWTYWWFNGERDIIEKVFYTRILAG